MNESTAHQRGLEQPLGVMRNRTGGLASPLSRRSIPLAQHSKNHIGVFFRMVHIMQHDLARFGCAVDQYLAHAHEPLCYSSSHCYVLNIAKRYISDCLADQTVPHFQLMVRQSIDLSAPQYVFVNRNREDEGRNQKDYNYSD